MTVLAMDKPGSHNVNSPRDTRLEGARATRLCMVAICLQLAYQKFETLLFTKILLERHRKVARGLNMQCSTIGTLVRSRSWKRVNFAWDVTRIGLSSSVGSADFAEHDVLLKPAIRFKVGSRR